jgi:hypothetical protein
MNNSKRGMAHLIDLAHKLGYVIYDGAIKKYINHETFDEAFAIQTKGYENIKKINTCSRFIV